MNCCKIMINQSSECNGYTLLKILKGTGVFFDPTLKRFNSIIFAEICIQTMIGRMLYTTF